MDYLPIFYTSLVTILILIAVGFFLGKIKLVNEAANKVFANLLLSVAMPCALFSAFPHQFNSESWHLFLLAVGGGLAELVAAVIAAKLLFARHRIGRFYFQHQFAFIFNNASFLGYPLTLAVFGAESMIIYSGLMLVFNVLLFSYGIWLFEHQLNFRLLRQIVFNPNIIAVILGLIFFLTSTSLPDFANQAISYLGSLTTPLSLIVIGFMLSHVSNWAKIFRRHQLFITCTLQLLFMPAMTYLVLALLHMPPMVRQMFTMIQALPTATSLALFTEKYGGDKTVASELVLISTIMSVITLPLVMNLVFRL